MRRFYHWTPDECIPQFYCDPQIFYSQHSGVTDIVVPSWASSPQEFIELHRAALESGKVSKKIHQWIDITFGYKMSGQEAVTAKKVTVSSSDPTMPDVLTFNVLINSYCRKGDFVSGLELFREMREKGCVPNVVNLTTLIKGFFREGKFEEGIKLAYEMYDLGYKFSNVTRAILVAVLCKLNSILINMMFSGNVT
ncbi:WD repeat-containing protein 81 [Euphorbia peplus]|nr:WD repeat-containing protein 81 [Euphorbia peplus]